VYGELSAGADQRLGRERLDMAQQPVRTSSASPPDAARGAEPDPMPRRTPSACSAHRAQMNAAVPATNGRFRVVRRVQNEQRAAASLAPRRLASRATFFAPVGPFCRLVIWRGYQRHPPSPKRDFGTLVHFFTALRERRPDPAARAPHQRSAAGRCAQTRNSTPRAGSPVAAVMAAA
jgi:hypothetical protein